MTDGIVTAMFWDPQQEKPACYCPRCGGARYAPGLFCIRCEEEGYDT